MLRNALNAAEQVIDRAERIALSERDTRVVLDLLDNPRELNARLVAAAETIPRDAEFNKARVAAGLPPL